MILCVSVFVTGDTTSSTVTALISVADRI